ncbi:MAG: hypothetical protein ACSW8F_04415 [bacterium]
MSRLATPLITVRCGASRLYGGAQGQLPRRRERRYGCGLTAGANVLCRLMELGPEVEGEKYNRLCRRLKWLTPLGLGLRGTNGWLLAVGMNLCFLTGRLGHYAFWGMSAKKLWCRVEASLARDIPVILAIGPNIPKFWSREAVPFYQKAPSGALVRVTAARAHFVTVTALEGDQLTISSWGRAYILLRSEYEVYARRNGGFFVSNVMVISDFHKEANA